LKKIKIHYKGKKYLCRVSNEDFTIVSAYKWSLSGKPGNFYVRRRFRLKGKRRSQKLHRFILGIEDPRIKIDHKDGDFLNNCRKNLRKATCSQNSQNAKTRKDNTSGVKGVHWSPEGNKSKPGWIARVQVNGKRLYVGKFRKLEEATAAREKAAKQNHKEFAYEARA
jgi:hypothetical protein